MIHLNIHSLRAKRSNLIEMMEALKQNHCHVDAFLPCETYTNNINENECKIPGYNLICNHRLDNNKKAVRLMAQLIKFYKFYYLLYLNKRWLNSQ